MIVYFCIDLFVCFDIKIDFFSLFSQFLKLRFEIEVISFLKLRILQLIVGDGAVNKVGWLSL